MTQVWQGWAITAGAGLMLGACAPEPGINAKGETFAAIGAKETVSLVGTEPFWSLEISGGEAVWSTPEKPDGVRFAAKRFAGNNGLGFSGTLEGADFTATVTQGTCSDGMSDREFPFTATVLVGERTFAGCAFSSRNPYKGLEAP